MAGAIRDSIQFTRPVRALALWALLLTGCDSGRPGSPLAPTPPTPDPAPQREAWVELAPLPGARFQPGAVALNGTVYVAGGVAPDGRARPEILAFDPVLELWRVVGTLNQAVRSPAVVTLNGLIYIVGGATDAAFEPRGDLQILDPATGAVSSGPPMPTPRVGLAAVVHNGRIHAIGGVYLWEPGDLMGEWAPFHDVFDPATGQWTARAPLANARGGHAAFSLAGRIFVAGGYAPSMEAWDSATDTWSQLSSPAGGFGAAGAVIGSTAYVLGGSIPPLGCCGGWVPRNSVHRFDPANLGWREMPSMPFVRTGHAAAASGNAIYVIGGSPTGAFSDASGQVMRYRP